MNKIYIEPEFYYTMSLIEKNQQLINIIEELEKWLEELGMWTVLDKLKQLKEES